MSKITNQINNIIRCAGWAKMYSDLSDCEKYAKITGMRYVDEDMLNDPKHENRLIWLIPGGINFNKDYQYPDEPIRPNVIANTEEQDEIQESVINQVNEATSKLVINVDGVMNNIIIPDNGIAVTLNGEIQSGATITNLSSKPLIIDNTGTEEFPDIIIESPNYSTVTLKGQYNNVWYAGQYILASNAKIQGEVVFDSCMEGKGKLSVSADWVENVKVISYNTNELTIYNSTQDDVLESIEVIAPNATVIMEGEWDKVIASTGYDTLKLKATFHAQELIINRGSVIVFNANIEDAYSNITLNGNTCVPFTHNLSANAKIATDPGIYNFTSDFTNTYVMSFNLTQRGHFRINLNGYNVTTTKSNTAAFLQKGINNIIDVYSEGSTLTTAGYGYWVSSQGCVANIYGGHWISSTHAMYAEKGEINIYGGKFEVTGEDKRYVLNCYDASYKSGIANITVYGGEFVDFDPAHSTSEEGNPSFVAEGYKSVQIDEHTWKVVPEDEEITPWVAE